MSALEFRIATIEDIETILELWRTADAPPTSTQGPDAVRGVLQRDQESLLLATVDGQIVGTLIAAWDGWRGNMYRLAVHPIYRRQGVASALFAEAERRLRERGCRRISALVLRNEPHAMGFWREAGFSEQPEIARFSRNLT